MPEQTAIEHLQKGIAYAKGFQGLPPENATTITEDPYTNIRVSHATAILNALDATKRIAYWLSRVVQDSASVGWKPSVEESEELKGWYPEAEKALAEYNKVYGDQDA